MMTPIECQAARAELQWTRERLAREAGVEIGAIVAFELETTSPQPSLVAAITGALEAARTILPPRPTLPGRVVSTS